MTWFCEEVIYSGSPEVRVCGGGRASGSDLALAQRNGTHVLGEVHDISKLVEVRSGVSARGQDENEGSRGGGLLEDHRQI